MNAKIDMKAVIDGLNKKQEGAEKVIKRTVSDMKSRAPGWVSKAVREEYGVDAKEVKAALHTEKNGTMRLGGTEVDNVALVYRGRVLTPTHFQMRPKVRSKGGHDRVTAAIKKDHRKQLSPIAFLASASRRDPESTHIPFQRRGRERTPIDVIKTLSVPQMIEGKDGIKPKIEKAIEEGLKKRFDNHCEQLLNK